MGTSKHRSFRAAIVALSFVVACVCGVPSRGNAAALEFVNLLRDGEESVEGLAGVLALAMAPDGRHVYAVAPANNAVTVLARDPESGALSEVQVQRDGVGDVDGIEYASAVVVSPDGAFVYVAGAWENAVTAFARDVTTGKLTFLAAVREGVGGVQGLRYARALAISPDGQFLYAAGQKSDAIAVFKRNTLTGWLTFLEAQQQPPAGSGGIPEPVALTVTPDGAELYGASYEPGSVVAFARDRVTGHLTPRPPAPEADLGTVGVHSVAVSPDGAFVYATRQDDDAIAMFRRDRVTGDLRFVDVVAQGIEGVDGLYGVFWVTLSPDGRRLYAASTLDYSVSAFARDPASGTITFLEKSLGAPSRACLAFARSVIVSPDNRHVYVAGASSNAVAAFRVGEPDATSPP